MAADEATCGATGCQAEVKTRGFCGMHYQRFRKHGDPLATKPPGRRPGNSEAATEPDLPDAPQAPPIHRPALVRDLFEALWPITGPHNRVQPTKDETQGLCAVAMLEVPSIAKNTGVELLGVVKFKIIPTASNPRATAHPESSNCPYTLRATAKAARRQGATA